MTTTQQQTRLENAISTLMLSNARITKEAIMREVINNPEIIDWTSLELDTDYISFNKRKSRSIARTYFTEVYKK